MCKSSYHVRNWDPIKRDAKVYENILDTIGNTPLVKLNKIPDAYNLACDIYVKCEFINPGGSVKDRVAYQMIEQAQHNKDIRPGMRLVEPTSGNTGIGIALSSAVLGYKATVVTPDKNSDDKLFTEDILGAEVIQTPDGVPYDDKEDSHVIAEEIVKNDPNAFCLNQLHRVLLDDCLKYEQELAPHFAIPSTYHKTDGGFRCEFKYKNPVNVLTHEEQTGGEILAALKSVDMLVSGTGTGGTLTGLGRRLKRANTNCKVIAVDPLGSIIFNTEGKYKPFLIEGIGGNHVPNVLDKSLVDFVVTPNDSEAFNMAREIIRKEGILCGGSSGAAVFGAIQAARHFGLGTGSKVVVILPDGIRNYMNKFICDQWMEAHIFMDPPHRNYRWWNEKVCNLPIKSVPKLTENDEVLDAIKAMEAERSSVVVVVSSNDGGFLGAVTKNSLRHDITVPKGYPKKELSRKDPLKKRTMKDCFTLVGSERTSTIGRLARMLDITPFVVILQKTSETNDAQEIYSPSGIITQEMMWDFIEKELPE